MTTDPATAIATIMAMEPDSTKLIYRQQGHSAWKFSELCAFFGYGEAKALTERIIGWECCPKSCRLLTTYNQFLTALASIKASAQT